MALRAAATTLAVVGGIIGIPVGWLFFQLAFLYSPHPWNILAVLILPASAASLLSPWLARTRPRLAPVVLYLASLCVALGILFAGTLEDRPLQILRNRLTWFAFTGVPLLLSGSVLHILIYGSSQRAGAVPHPPGDIATD